jgi:hypothetical protein
MKTTLLALAVLIIVPSVQAALPGAAMLASVIEDHFDTNSDGKLDHGEWVGGLSDGFDHIDSGGDGTITAAELDALATDLESEVGSIGAPIVGTLVKRLVMSLDKDKNGSVTRAEFTELGTSMFKKLDADTSGDLSSEELAELPSKFMLG